MTGRLEAGLAAQARLRRGSGILALSFPGPEVRLGNTQMEFVVAAADEARNTGYELVLWAGDDEQLRARLQESAVDGVLMMEVHLDDPRAEMLSTAGVPFAVIGRSGARDENWVDIDFAATTERAVDHLTSLGHSRIALLNHSFESRVFGYGPAVRSSEGYSEAMRRRGLAPIETQSEEYREAGRAAMAELLDDHPEVTALVAMNEEASLGALNELERRGITVPDEFSVISIATSPGVNERISPPPTTMHAPSARLGRLGVRMLVSLLDESADQQPTRLVSCDFRPGKSTGPAPR